MLPRALVAAAAAAAAAADIVLDGRAVAHTYDGHGALSAGASSRALRDYPEPQRSEVLDYLFKPGFGASLPHLKVEIGGDCQSTDGTEPSHMHNRDELSCSVDRGYELWLLQQAKLRNPNLITYALSWGVPAWVGNGSYFSAENQAYQVAFASCVREVLGSPLDYIGVWNERSWGSVDYVLGLRSALDSAGFTHTQIALPDGLGGQVTSAIDAIVANSSFRAAVHAVGLHYPCHDAEPRVAAEGLAYWASEDYSTVADWAGAGCWGRSLVDNYVRLNATSTIAWSLIWSVYPSLPYFGNGLMYAYEAHSGHYEVNAALWTSAHFTQFTQPGWRFLSVASGSSGFLPGGGSYVTLVPPAVAPASTDFTLVLQTLEGDCLRCKGSPTTAQTLRVVLTGGLAGPGATLRVWSTNATAQFVRLPDVAVAADGSFVVSIGRDAMVTVTTLDTGAHGGFPSSPIPASAPFPLPYADDFSGYAEDALARYFSDQAGSFAVRGGALQQVVEADPGPNAWVGDNDPISLLGDGGWGDVLVAVTAAFNASAAGRPWLPAPAPVAARGAPGGGRPSERSVPHRLAVHGATAATLGAAAGDATPPALLALCDASSPHQRWALGAPAAGYLSNAAGAAGAGGGPACLNVDACGSDVVFYECVTSGGTCAGATSYTDLQWALDAPSGRLTSALNGDCLTWTASSGGGGGGSMSVQPCVGGARAPPAQSWSFNASSGLLQLADTGNCLTTPVPPTYVQLCGRVTGYSGFTRQTVPGYCMRVNADGSWAITAGPKLGVVASGALAPGGGGWSPSAPTKYALALNGNLITAFVGGVPVGSFTDDDLNYAVGLVALGSGYHYAVFDSFSVASSA